MRGLLILFFLLLNLQANVIEAYYKVSYGIIGEVGVAKARFEIYDNKTYTIDMEANTTGIAKSLSGDRREIFQSKGLVRDDGRLVPKTYLHEVRRMKRKSGFTLDPNRWKKVPSVKLTIVKFGEKTIHEYKTKSLDGEVYSKSNKTLDFIVHDDLLSLFFNFKVQSNDFNITKKTPFYAVGADKKDGRLDILPMPKSLQREFFENTKGHNFIAIVNKPVFASKKGELLVRLDDDGICTKAVLRDVLFFGDIRGELVKKNVF